MTVYQKKQAVNKGLRNCRKTNRALQSQAEILERVLDRLILRKTLVTPGQLVQAQAPYQALKLKFTSLEAALRDTAALAQVG